MEREAPEVDRARLDWLRVERETSHCDRERTNEDRDVVQALRQLVRDHQEGLVVGQRRFTVAEATESWLTNGLAGRSPATVENRRVLAQTHLIPALGRRQVADLTASEIDGWLAGCATRLSTDTVRRLLSILRASLRRAQARDLVSRNVALLCDPPRGRVGRPSKALNLDQAVRLISAAEQDATMRAYVVLSLLTGARTEELRALTWAHVDLEGDSEAEPAGSAFDCAVAIRPGEWRHEDPLVSPDP